MKTSDGKPCADCGSAKDLQETIKKACIMLAQGHLGLMSLYQQLYSSSKEPADREAFLAASIKHKRLSDETLQATIPTESAPDEASTPVGSPVLGG